MVPPPQHQAGIRQWPTTRRPPLLPPLNRAPQWNQYLQWVISSIQTKHINIVVSVALEDGAQRGTADDIVVGFSSPGREFSVPHDRNITIDRTTCS